MRTTVDSFLNESAATWLFNGKRWNCLDFNTGSASTQSTSSQKRYLESEAPPFPFFGIELDIITSSPRPVLDPSTFWSIHSESRTNLGGWQEEGGKLAGDFDPGTHIMKDGSAQHRARPLSRDFSNSVVLCSLKACFLRN